jgi:alpha-beta hydrolase superfamily lysophospholipase
VSKRLLPLPDPPQELGRRDGLAYALFLPPGEPLGGVVIVHGASSCKESHFDFARALRGNGIAAVCFDQRGHGDSEGALDARALGDVATMASLLPPGPVALRGSSMGGYVALAAAGRVGARAVMPPQNLTIHR